MLEPYPLLRIVVSIGVNALALWICSALFGGVTRPASGPTRSALPCSAFANTILKPILAILTLPLIVFTLGLFYLLINIAMVALAEWIAPNFSIDGFWDVHRRRPHRLDRELGRRTR